MTRFFTLLALSILFFEGAKAQTEAIATQKQLTDSICNCLTKTDISKITNKQQAVGVFTDCFSKKTDLLMKLADEKKVNPTDQQAMRQIGIDVGKDLFKQNCEAFTKISVIMAKSEESKEEGNGTSEGTFLRINLKGFNYLVIKDKNSIERSFIWLEHFAGSEKFMSATGQLAGKKLKIGWHEIEVYMPEAKGYYTIKEILSVDFL